MKIYILSDLEGIAGVVSIPQVRSDTKDYEKARRYMTGEVAAAAQACLEAGAEKVVIDDGHADMTNLIIDELPKDRVEIVSGKTKPFLTEHFKEEKFDAALFIGYHPGKGTVGGVLDHTVFGRAFDSIKINGEIVSEFYIDAGSIGQFGVPVIFIAGDDKITQEAKSLVPGIEALAVKRGISRYSAFSMHPEAAKAEIKKAVRRALANIRKVKPLKVKTPVHAEIRLADCGLADAVSLIPTVERVDGHTVRYKSRSMQEFGRTLDAVCLVCSAMMK